MGGLVVRLLFVSCYCEGRPGLSSPATESIAPPKQLVEKQERRAPGKQARRLNALHMARLILTTLEFQSRTSRNRSI